MSTTENRQEPRAPIELRVEYTRLNTFFADYTKNLSKGGTFIKTASPLPVGTQFKFQLAIPNFPKPVELTGEVTWALDSTGAAERHAEAGMGIKFIFSNPEEQRAFESSVEQLMYESLGEDIARRLLGRTG